MLDGGIGRRRDGPQRVTFSLPSSSVVRCKSWLQHKEDNKSLSPGIYQEKLYNLADALWEACKEILEIDK